VIMDRAFRQKNEKSGQTVERKGGQKGLFRRTSKELLQAGLKNDHVPKSSLERDTGGVQGYTKLVEVWGSGGQGPKGGKECNRKPIC